MLASSSDPCRQCFTLCRSGFGVAAALAKAEHDGCLRMRHACHAHVVCIHVVRLRQKLRLQLGKFSQAQ